MNRDHAEGGLHAALFEEGGNQLADRGRGWVRHGVQSLLIRRYGCPSCKTTDSLRDKERPRGLVGPAEARKRNVFLRGERGCPRFPRFARRGLRVVAPPPLTRFDDADQDRIDADALGRELGRERFDEAQRAGARRRSRDHVRLGLQREQRIHAGDARRTRRAQQRQERARRADDAEVFQFEFVAPRVVRRVRERRHAALARVVDEHVGAAEALCNGLRERGHVGFVEHVATHGKHALARELPHEPRVRAREPLIAAAAYRDRRARAQEELGARVADAGRAARHHGDLPAQVDLDHRNPNAFK